MDPVSILAVGAMLGEGPVWIGDAVWFVDIKGHEVHRFDPVWGFATETRIVGTRWDALAPENAAPAREPRAPDYSCSQF